MGKRIDDARQRGALTPIESSSYIKETISETHTVELKLYKQHEKFTFYVPFKTIPRIGETIEIHIGHLEETFNFKVKNIIHKCFTEQDRVNVSKFITIEAEVIEIEKD